jgi:hypothetical protein
VVREHSGSIRRARAEEKYNELLRQGLSKEQAERIAKAPVKKTSRPAGKQSDYQGWSKRALSKRAQELQVTGRSDMNKQQLINAIRRLEALMDQDESDVGAGSPDAD